MSGMGAPTKEILLTPKPTAITKIFCESVGLRP